MILSVMLKARVKAVPIAVLICDLFGNIICVAVFGSFLQFMRQNRWATLPRRPIMITD